MTRRLSIALLVLCTCTLWSADQPFAGTWKLNPAKSTSDGPSWKSRTLTISVDGDTRKFKSNGVTSDGKQLSGGYEAKFDGKDYPVTGQIGGAETISIKQESPTEVRFVMKKGGKAVSSGRSTLSSDGKTMTITAKGTSAEGKPFTSTLVYEK